ncbi:MAG: hypothetical protein U0W24_04160 [Bacteroidales bacterium]
MKKILFFILYAIVFAIASKFIYSEYEVIKNEREANRGGYDKAIKNYRKEVDSLAKIFDLSPSYLMAVIMLESSGKKNPPVRYERKIYDQLLKLQNGEIDKFENLKKADIKRIPKKRLKEYACSYGPFQIMGYKAFLLDIPLESLKGKKNLYFAIKWINLTYGDFVRDEDYKDAFHIHNAGKKYPESGSPTTHDPDYVNNGLKYMKYFEDSVFKDK